MAAILNHTPHTSRSKAPLHSIASQRTIADALKKAGVSDAAADTAAEGYEYAQQKRHGDMNQSTMAVVDFSKPSDQKRLYVVNIKTGSLMGKYYVAHGQGSGGRYAEHFSNRPNSHESCLGAFAVGHIYYGKHGRSRHMVGLESGVNSNAVSRDIELHRAAYVSPFYIKHVGRAGRTYGCFGINPSYADKIISQLSANTVLFAYASPENYDDHLAG